MPVTDFVYNADPTEVGTVAVASGLGDQSEELWYSNIIEKTAFFHWLTGRPQDADGAYNLAVEGKAAGIRMFDGGPAIRERMVFQVGNTNIWLKGWDEFPYEGSDELREFLFGPRWAVLPVGIALDEMRANQHRARPTDLLREKVEIAMEVFAEDLGDQIINSDGTDAGGKVILGLAAFIRSNPTVAWTIGGWDLSANSQLRNRYNANLTRAPSAGAAGAFATNGRRDVREMYQLTYQYIKAKRTQVILVSNGVWREWMEGLESRDIAIVQDQSQKRGGTPGGEKVLIDGWTAIQYNNAVVMPDEKMPDGSAAAFSNMLLFLTLGAIRLHIDSEYWLSTTPLERHKGQLASSLEILFSGQMTSGAPGRQGILDGYDNPS